MKLAELLNGINTVQVTGNFSNEEVTSIEYDSRKVKNNSLFVAVKGFKVDGHKFISDALNNGAKAIVLDNDQSVLDGLFQQFNSAKVVVKDSRTALAEISDYYYAHPSRKLKLIGITGTNGKTTTTYLLKNIFETAGFKTGLLGTIANYIGEKKIESKLTTPEANDLNQMLSQMVGEGCKYAVMEVSSHSLALKRVHNLFYSSAIFTNITEEHLDFHKDFKNYLEAKKLLFDSLDESSNVIYNADDKSSSDVLKDCKAKIFSYGITSQADFSIRQVEYDLGGTSFIIHHRKNDYKIETSLIGEFNAYNAAAAFAVSKLNGLDNEQIISGIKSTPQIPGRFEVISEGYRNVIVDYSHTSDSLEKALKAVHKLNKNYSKIITVFGCGGNRDKLKRPEMGKIATELSDEVVLTSDNPRDEDPYSIIDEIKSGISKKNFRVIENREEAIGKAIGESEKNSIILIAGKGHEDYQEINGKRYYFSDREVAENYLRN